MDEVMNAVSKLEGELLNAVYANMHKSNYKKSDVFLHKVLTNWFDPNPVGSFVIYSSDEPDRDDVEFICTTDEFLATVSECETNFSKCKQSYSDYKFDYHLPPEPTPAYTQEMADNGVLPPIGSKFIDVELSDDDEVVEAIAHDIELGRVIYKRGSTLQDSEYFGAVACECKPLTPPITLIDGKAYQFDYNEKKSIHCIYVESGNIFLSSMGSYCPDGDCTNIQPLTVEVK